MTPRAARPAALAAVLLLAGLTPAQPPKPDPYPFPLPPVALVDRLAKGALGPVAPFAGDERALLGAVWAARSGPKPRPVAQADERAVRAHLLASGVADPAARAKYVKAFDALVADAEKATAAAETAGDKADRLLRFLHAGVMAKGYAADQTTLRRRVRRWAVRGRAVGSPPDGRAARATPSRYDRQNPTPGRAGGGGFCRFQDARGRRSAELNRGDVLSPRRQNKRGEWLRPKPRRTRCPGSANSHAPPGVRP